MTDLALAVATNKASHIFIMYFMVCIGFVFDVISFLFVLFSGMLTSAEKIGWPSVVFVAVGIGYFGNFIYFWIKARQFNVEYNLPDFTIHPDLAEKVKDAASHVLLPGFDVRLVFDEETKSAISDFSWPFLVSIFALIILKILLWIPAFVVYEAAKDIEGTTNEPLLSHSHFILLTSILLTSTIFINLATLVYGHLTIKVIETLLSEFKDLIQDDSRSIDHPIESIVEQPEIAELDSGSMVIPSVALSILLFVSI